MLVANSFDQWRRDTFFSAAEEVQQSADIMGSAYRTWIRVRREGATPDPLDELSRELQMALGTAKWQLEEFEKAVRLSYRNRADEITMTRHRQFVSAIADQISHVEAALKESFNMEGKQSLQWVYLDEKERDDLALFLSGSPLSSQSTKDESESANVTEVFNINVKVCPKSDIPDQGTSFNDVTISNTDSHHANELEGPKTPQTRINVVCQADYRVSNRRMWNSPNIGKIDLVIEDKNKIKNPSISDIEAASKKKGFRSSFWSPTSEDHPQGKRQIFSFSLCRRSNWMNQQLGPIAGCQRQLQNTPIYSIRFMLALMLTIFLVVPFVFYSS